MVIALLSLLYAVLAFLLAGMAFRLSRTLRQAKAPNAFSPLALEVDLPSVTVCIPARNEQHALTECLERVIASRYEKLEIIVLDDESVDDTSILIKSFAHAGVRFVRGGELPEGWLGKNHALQRLLEESSGSYILFMDVDTRLAPQAIENIVRYALSKRAAMVSVLPRREDGLRVSVVGSTLRFFWEVLFHRKDAPATASNAWLVNRTVLSQRLHGFTGRAHAPQPESALAAELAKTNEYRFLVGSSAFGFAFEKKWRSQVDTSIRLLFPLLGAQVGLAAVAMLDLLILLLPFLISVVFGSAGNGWLALPGVVFAIGFMVLYGWYAHTVWKRGWLIGAVLWPVLLIQEAVLIGVSAYRYQRKTVTWRGRPIESPRL